MSRRASGIGSRLVMWLTLALLTATGAVLIHLMIRFYPQGPVPEFAPPRPAPPSTAQVIGWVLEGALTLGAVVFWALLAVWQRGR